MLDAKTAQALVTRLETCASELEDAAEWGNGKQDSNAGMWHSAAREAREILSQVKTEAVERRAALHGGSCKNCREEASGHTLWIMGPDGFRQGPICKGQIEDIDTLEPEEEEGDN